MVLEALGIIFGSLTAITLGALKFAEVIDRRKRAEDKADLKLEEENALAEGLASKPLRIYPFADQGYSNSSRCLNLQRANYVQSREDLSRPACSN